CAWRASGRSDQPAHGNASTPQDLHDLTAEPAAGARHQARSHRVTAPFCTLAALNVRARGFSPGLPGPTAPPAPARGTGRDAARPVGMRNVLRAPVATSVRRAGCETSGITWGRLSVRDRTALPVRWRPGVGPAA